jgi:hypothetical protein
MLHFHSAASFQLYLPVIGRPFSVHFRRAIQHSSELFWVGCNVSAIVNCRSTSESLRGILGAIEAGRGDFGDSSRFERTGAVPFDLSPTLGSILFPRMQSAIFYGRTRQSSISGKMLKFYSDIDAANHEALPLFRMSLVERRSEQCDGNICP